MYLHALKFTPVCIALEAPKRIISAMNILQSRKILVGIGE